MEFWARGFGGVLTLTTVTHHWCAWVCLVLVIKILNRYQSSIMLFWHAFGKCILLCHKEDMWIWRPFGAEFCENSGWTKRGVLGSLETWSSCVLQLYLLGGNIISIIWVLLIALMSCITHSSLGKCRPKRNQLCLVKILILPQHINLCSCNWTSLGPCHPSMSHPCMWNYVPGHYRTACSTVKCLGTFEWWLIDHAMQSLFIILSSKL